MQGHFDMELLIFPQCPPKTPSFHRNAAGLPSSGEKKMSGWFFQHLHFNSRNKTTHSFTHNYNHQLTRFSSNQYKRENVPKEIKCSQ